MLDSISAYQKLEIAETSPSPPLYRVTGNFLAKSNGKSLQSRLEVALRILCEGEAVAIENPTVSQIARLCRVPRAMIDKRLGTHSSRFTPAALAKAFKTWSEDDRVEFIHLIGSEKVWAALERAI
jgi:hypothetical protein